MRCGRIWGQCTKGGVLSIAVIAFLSWRNHQNRKKFGRTDGSLLPNDPQFETEKRKKKKRATGAPSCIFTENMQGCMHSSLEFAKGGDKGDKDAGSCSQPFQLGISVYWTLYL